MIKVKSVLSAMVLLGTLAGASVSSAQFPGNDRGRGDDRGRDDRGRDDRGRDDRGSFGRTVTVYRLTNGKDSMLSLDRREAGHLGYREDSRIEMFADGGGNRVAIYRCLVLNQGHFASTDANCEGQNAEGLLGFAERRPTRDAGQELVRCFNRRAGRHLITTDVRECRGDMRTESTLGFVLR